MMKTAPHGTVSPQMILLGRVDNPMTDDLDNV